jgi:4-hydroxybenzoate polyprenyltransferase
LNIHDPLQCLALFKFNGVVGLIIFAGLVLSLLVRLI